MSSTAGIARSGLLVSALSLDVSANNVANVLTEDFEPSRVAQAEVEGGGVTGEVEKVPEPATGGDPMAEVRADRALLFPGRVDLVQETVNQSRAAAVYRASLATLETADDMQKELVQALGK